MSALGRFVVAVVLAMLTTLTGGLLLSVLWAWFLVPVFPTLPHLSVMNGVGLSYVMEFPFMTVSLRQVLADEDNKTTGWQIAVGMLIFQAIMFMSAGVWHMIIR